MDSAAIELKDHFLSLSDEELLRRCASGRLTSEAQRLAEAELTARGLTVPPRPPESVAERDDATVYPGDFRAVARLLEPTEAYLIESYLKSFDIPVFVADANLVQAQSLWTGAVGGASVRVPERFVGEATELIARFRNGEFSLDDAHVDDTGSEPIAVAVAPDRRRQRLKTYRVYGRPGKPVPMVVRVGFSWPAVLIGPLWFLLNRMWSNFLVVGAFTLGGYFYMNYYRPHSPAGELGYFGFLLLNLLVWWLIGKYANAILCAELEDAGYRLLATVQAKNAGDARGQAVDTAAAHTAESTQPVV